VEPFASLTNSIADSLRRWKAFVIPGYKFAEENTAKYNPIPYSLVLTLIS